MMMMIKYRKIKTTIKKVNKSIYTIIIINY